MKTSRRIVVLSVLAAWLLAGCATPPEPFEYQQSNELKPGPGIFTGEEGVYTIYGPPPQPAEDNPGAYGDKGALEDPDDPVDP